MKFFAAFVLCALFAVASVQSQPVETEKKIEPVKETEQAEPQADAPRDKRGLLLSATYTSPVAYAAYSAPYVYAANYHYPYTYSYRSYPYFYGYY
ncbi:hypothetical protein KPH14_010292 [Odynerus spinipes]|uniref:Uncharacterized protein n=1 Tax=Odynerus spinipes TaxID=1348599 RepID=A0AAD9VTM8_9HYME|nr:hypothetical protein KPH14_010292 [Odynerus spinipes]